MPKGFTLVELLVTISIIAILATVGIVVFTNTQKKARDAKRIEDINAISNVLEINYNLCSPSKYCNLQTNYFNQSIPQDSLKDQYKCGQPGDRNCNYCILDNIGMVNFNFSSGFSHNGCNPTVGVGNTPTNFQHNIVQQDSPGGSNYYDHFVICANLEAPALGGNYYYCVPNKR